MSRWVRFTLRAAVVVGSAALAAGQTSPEPSRSFDALLKEMQEMRAALYEVRGQLADVRRESEELRNEVGALRNQLADVRPEQPVDRAADADDRALAEARVNDLYQTKVASGSRYRVRLSGMALFNLASTRGTVDQIDLPLVARPAVPGSGGSFAATVRQSMVNLEVFGPDWKGGRTGAEITADFFGGFPATPEGVATGLMRLRTAKATLDWKNTSIVAGQDVLFFSPLSPTSLASSAYPPFSYAGNLWTWTPQINVEHRFDLSERSKISIAGGVLDPL